MQLNIETIGKYLNTTVTLVSVSSSILKEPKPLVNIVRRNTHPLAEKL